MVDPESLVLKKDNGENNKYDQCDHFLEYFELHQGKRTARTPETDTVGGYLKAIFEKCNAPTNKNDGNNAELGKPLPFAKF